MILSRIFMTFFLILYCPQAFSIIEITDVRGAGPGPSHWTYNPNTNSLSIWAGLGGPNRGGRDEICDETCNNCLGGTQSCNEHSINLNGDLIINFRSDTQSGIPIITDFNKQAISNPAQNSIPTSANTTVEIGIPWSQICALPSANNCQDNVQVRLSVGIDGSNNGSGNGSLDNDAEDDSLQFTINIRLEPPPDAYIPIFSLFPGDEKIIMLTPADEGEGELGIIRGDSGISPRDDGVSPIEFPDSFPSYGNTRITHIRFYYVEVPNGEDGCNFATQIGNNSDYVETEVTDLGEGSTQVELSDLYFKEDAQQNPFQNNLTYVFKIALVDEAGNVGLFYNGTCDPVTHVITPSEVHGLLPECFIATAAYGKSHKILETFYQFRDQKLLPYILGKIIHTIYYTYSPPLANIIQDSAFLKYIARILLIPFWIYAFLALQIGHILTFFLLASSISILIYFFIKKNVII